MSHSLTTGAVVDGRWSILARGRAGERGQRGSGGLSHQRLQQRASEGTNERINARDGRTRSSLSIVDARMRFLRLFNANG